MSEPLRGEDLLSRLRQLPETAGKTAKAKACGYVTQKRDGSERVNFTAFYAALLQAQGVQLEPARGSRPGRRLSYLTTVLQQGHAVVGSPYLQQAGIAPGDAVMIKASRGRVTLTKA